MARLAFDCSATGVEAGRSHLRVHRTLVYFVLLRTASRRDAIADGYRAMRDLTNGGGVWFAEESVLGKDRIAHKAAVARVVVLVNI